MQSCTMLRERATLSSLIVTASKQYGDNLHLELKKQEGTIPVHRKCVDKYCHKKTIQKALRAGEQSPSAEDLMSKPKRTRRSVRLKFSHCLFCGEECGVVKDPKHPDRWRPAYVCREGENRDLE